MAKLTRDDVLRLARLARLELSEDEIVKFQDELGSILGYVEQLKDVDMTGLEPTTQVTRLKNVTRKDEPIDYTANQQELLKNVPDVHDDHLKVKRMVA